ncbi:MAG TPA: hypothetical protein VHL05_12220, partial [Terriglobales bacterium]|nr:hypothetical protein [Terriglobales bacterium]
MSKNHKGKKSSVHKATASNGRGTETPPEADSSLRTYAIADYRLEKPVFRLQQVHVGNEVK